MADLFIVGQFYGVDSITAVANGSQVLHMLTVIIVGLAMGTTVAIGRAVGGRRLEDAAHAIGNTITLFMIVAVVFTAGLFMLCPSIVLFIGTPEEAIAGSIRYLTICFIGIPFITAYNIISSIFREWEIPKARCTLSGLPVWEILYLIISLSVQCSSDRRELHWGQRCPRHSV